MKKLVTLTTVLCLTACGAPEHKNLRGQHTNTNGVPVAPPTDGKNPAALVKASAESLLECRAPEGQNYWFDCHLTANPVVLAKGDATTVRSYKIKSLFNCPIGGDGSVALMPLAVAIKTGETESVRPLSINTDVEFEIQGSGDLVVKATDAVRLQKYQLGTDCSLIVSAQLLVP